MQGLEVNLSLSGSEMFFGAAMARGKTQFCGFICHKKEGNMEDEIKFNYHEIIVVYQLNDDC